jgi:hypothetical protein
MPKIPVISAGEENIPVISEALVLVPSSTHTDSVILCFVMWTSLSQLSYYKGSHRTQNKQRNSYWHNNGQTIHSS